MPKQSIAQQRMQILYEKALEITKTDPERSRRYVQLLRKIAQRTRTKIPQHIKQNICKECNTPLISGYNATTRINQRREPHVTTTCHTCGNIIRRPIRSRET